MDSSVFIAGVICLLFSPAAPQCAPVDHTLYVEKQECDYCVAINTTICVGLCKSWDSNVRHLGGSRFVFQSSCTYDEVEYRTATLPGCPANANALFTYPVALTCHCHTCNTDSEDCAHRASGNGGGCKKPEIPYVHPEEYMLPI